MTAHAASAADAVGFQGSVAGHRRGRYANDGGTPETTYYVYDAAGQRVRKVTERQNGTRKDERIYLGGFEVYRKYDGSGTGVMLGARDTARDG